MKPRQLIKVSVATGARAEEEVMQLLTETFGQPAASYTDARTGRTTVSTYLPALPARLLALTNALRAGLGQLKAPSWRITVTRVRHEDWAESWKKHFQPIEIGHALLIKPSWIRRRPRKGQVVVVLDPGLSFGTGQHPTTRFCLEQLVAARNPAMRQSLLDLGTGSGILAIAGTRLGYGPVKALDYDPEAVRVARANAESNDVGNRIRLRRQDVTRMPLVSNRRYDVVCANLLTDLLIAERRRILSRLKPGGRLILAGILTGQFPGVREAYRTAGLKLLQRQTAGEWTSGTFT